MFFDETKLWKIVYFLFHDLFLIFYKFLIWFKKLQINNELLILYQLAEYAIFLGIFLSDYTNIKKYNKINSNLFSKYIIELGELICSICSILLNRIL